MWGPWSAAAAGAVCFLVLSVGTAAGAADALVLRDDLQRDVSFAASPRRIITMLPSLTETVCALDDCDRLVATDRYSNWPPEVANLPKAGGLDDAEVESIVSLEPDLVLLARSQRITERLRELGIRSFALNSGSFADIARSITVIGAILGDPERAARLNQRIDAEIADIARTAAARRHAASPTVYFEVDRGLYAAGPRSYIGELLAKLGARNIVTPELGPFPRLNPEYVVRHDPDVIFVSGADAPHLVERPGWNSIRAVRLHQLCSFAPAVDDTIVRPGPRVAEGMRAMAACLERFAP
jgi:iron complex transport system substrate-binding protein